jgi:hypothetical protein
MRLGVLIGLLLATSCDETPRGEQPQPMPPRETAKAAPTGAAPLPPAPPEEDPLAWERDVVLPVDPKHLKLELTPGWLDGYWVGNKGACLGSDSGIHFGADGTYSEFESGGGYQIRGDRIWTAVTEVYNGPPDAIGTRESARVRIVGPNELATDWGGGQKGPLYRCPPGGLRPEHISANSGD